MSRGNFVRNSKAAYNRLWRGLFCAERLRGGPVVPQEFQLPSLSWAFSRGWRDGKKGEWRGHQVWANRARAAYEAGYLVGRDAK